MKKVVKLIISAASALSVVGVGAASFAKWQGDTALDADYAANGAGLGHINAVVIGFTDTAESTTLSDKLVPYDQDGNDYEGVTFYSIALPEFMATGSYKVTVTVADGEALESGSAFYAQLGSPITAAPENLDDWTVITGTGAVLTGDYDTTAGADKSQLFTGKCVNIVLKSDSLKDMDKSGYNFTITLGEAA